MVATTMTIYHDLDVISQSPQFSPHQKERTLQKVFCVRQEEAIPAVWWVTWLASDTHTEKLWGGSGGFLLPTPDFASPFPLSFCTTLMKAGAKNITTFLMV